MTSGPVLSGWTWTIEPDALAAVVEALGGVPGEDPLGLMATWAAAHGGDDPGLALQRAGVPIVFTNWITEG